MNVFCYYNHVEKLSPLDETKLILEWKENWKAAGFTPIVLNEFIAQQHPRFAALEEAIEKRLPSINPAGYDKHCYFRWAAMSVSGGGIMADYDCFNYGWKPAVTPAGRLRLYQGHVPCLVTGDREGYGKMVEAFISYKGGIRDYTPEGKRHVSDMTIASFEGKKIGILMNNDVVDYSKDGWETATAVHYNTSIMTDSKKLPRWKFINQLRPWIIS